jgi:hypothetical protein
VVDFVAGFRWARVGELGPRVVGLLTMLHGASPRISPRHLPALPPALSPPVDSFQRPPLKVLSDVIQFCFLSRPPLSDVRTLQNLCPANYAPTRRPSQPHATSLAKYPARHPHARDRALATRVTADVVPGVQILQRVRNAGVVSGG